MFDKVMQYLLENPEFYLIITKSSFIKDTITTVKVKSSCEPGIVTQSHLVPAQLGDVIDVTRLVVTFAVAPLDDVDFVRPRPAKK